VGVTTLMVGDGTNIGNLAPLGKFWLCFGFARAHGPGVNSKLAGRWQHLFFDNEPARTPTACTRRFQAFVQPCEDIGLDRFNTSKFGAFGCLPGRRAGHHRYLVDVQRHWFQGEELAETDRRETQNLERGSEDVDAPANLLDLQVVDLTKSRVFRDSSSNVFPSQSLFSWLPIARLPAQGL